MPLWAALAACGAAYAIRGVLHNFDFRPELPLDGVIAVALLTVLLLVAYVRADDARRDANEQPGPNGDDERF